MGGSVRVPIVAQEHREGREREGLYRGAGAPRRTGAWRCSSYAKDGKDLRMTRRRRRAAQDAAQDVAQDVAQGVVQD